MLRGGRRAPTRHQLDVLAACIGEGSQKAAADRLGISYQTVKNTLHELYFRLDVTSEIGAMRALGWVSIPGYREACGWVGYCSRPAGHRGHHGGFRARLE